MKKKFFGGLFFFIFLGTISWVFWGKKQKAENTIEETVLKALDFNLPDTSGEMVSLKDFQNKVVLLTFWISECPFCIKEIPILKKIYTQYRDKDVEIISIATGESSARIQRVKNREAIPYPILLDEKKEVAYLYNIIGVPTDIIIDRKGNIRYYNFFWPNNLEEVIERLLKE